MNRKPLMAALGVLAIVAVASTPAAAASAPTPVEAGIARLASYGIDITKYKPGWKIVGDEVQWEAEQAALSFGPSFIGECTSGWVCLFENAHFDDWNQDGRDDGARMLKFSATGRWIYMADWNFNDKMSSWYNRRGLDARWYHNAWPQNPLPAICMNYGASGTYNAGEANNDKMSMLWIYTNSTTC